MASVQGEKLCLRWNDFEKNISSSFQDLRHDEDFFDVTLACDNSQLKAHKVILSACSPFFRSVLKKNPHQHPLLYLKGVKYEEILQVLDFMYHGEVNVAQDDLNSFLSVAEDLQVKGLTQQQPQPRHQSPASKTHEDQDSNPSPTKKQGRLQTTNEQQMASHEALTRKNVQGIAPEIKTEAQIVLDCDEESDTHEMIESSDYPALHGGYEYDQSYQNQNMMYQVGKVEMDMGQAGDNTQDPYEHIKGHVRKIPNETGFACAICGKKVRDMYMMREHVEALHDLSPGYVCNVCSQHCKNHKVLRNHLKKFHRN